MNRELTNRLFLVTAISFGLTGVFFTYISYRDAEFNLVSLNRAIGDVATLFLCFVLLAGPLGRNFSRFGFFMMHRKQFGLAAALYAYIHAIFSLFFLPDVFPISRFTFRNVPFLFGLGGVVILYVLFAYSFQYFIKTIKPKYWLILQSWGVRLSIVFVSLHYGIMKFPGWVEWLLVNGGESSRLPVPPTSLIVGAFCLFTVIVRITERLGKRAAQVFTVIGFNTFVMIVVFAGIWRYVHR